MLLETAQRYALIKKEKIHKQPDIVELSSQRYTDVLTPTTLVNLTYLENICRFKNAIT